MKNTYNTLKKLYPELIDPKIAEIRLFHFIRQEFEENERKVLLKFAEKLEGI